MTASVFNRRLAFVTLPSQAEPSARHYLPNKGWPNVTKKSDDSPKARLLIGIVVFIVFLGWSAFAAFWAVALFRHWNEPITPENAGLFGDSFGGVNALFSGLALVGVAYAVTLQHRELKATQEGERRNDEARAKTDQLMERQAQALLAAAKLNAAKATWESTDPALTTRRRLGEHTLNHTVRSIRQANIEMTCFESQELLSGTTNASQNHSSLPIRYLAHLAIALRSSIQVGIVSHPDDIRLELALLKRQLGLIALQDGIENAKSLEVLIKSYSALDSLLVGFGTDSWTGHIHELIHKSTLACLITIENDARSCQLQPPTLDP